MEARSVGVLTASVDDDSTDRTNSAEPRTATEKSLGEVLAGVLHIDRIPVDSHFFDDLGADSLVMAQFCARVKTPQPSVGVHEGRLPAPHHHRLATALAPTAPDEHESSTPAAVEVAAPDGTLQMILCGVLQLLAQHDTRQLTAVAIAPDLGERYLDTIFQTNWLVDIYGKDVLTSDELVTDSPAA